MSTKTPPVHVVLTGVCGTGQTGVAEHLSRRTGMPVADADSFHPATTRRKIATGQALCAADLTGQLHRMRDWIADRAVSGTSTLIACPPLSRASRDLLREAEDVVALTGQVGIRLVFIELTVPGSADRADRADRAEGADSAGIEPLEADEHGTTVDASGEPGDVADLVVGAIARLRHAHPVPPA